MTKITSYYLVYNLTDEGTTLQYWRAPNQGYTKDISEAHLYERDEAIKILSTTNAEMMRAESGTLSVLNNKLHRIQEMIIQIQRRMEGIR
jgi:hypothetical protein